MRNDLNLVRGALKSALAGGFLLAGIMLTASGAEDGTTAAEPYTWSAQLVELNAGQNRATFRSMLASHAAIADSADLDPGESMYLTWSGLRFANAVRALTRDAENAPAALTLPIRFEGMDEGGRYVTFSIEISEALAQTLDSLEPGHWVTATSPRFPFEMQEAVVAIRPYNDVE